MRQQITGADQAVLLVCHDGDWYWYDGRGEGEDGWRTPEEALADWRANPIDDSEDGGRAARWVIDATLQARSEPRKEHQ